MRRLVNETRGTVVALDVEQARGITARLKGLLGRSSLEEGHALVIEPCTSIHTFFMKFAIDVLFLNGGGLVVRALGDLRPFRATRVYPSAALVVELPAGAVSRTSTREGDRLVFEDV